MTPRPPIESARAFSLDQAKSTYAFFFFFSQSASSIPFSLPLLGTLTTSSHDMGLRS
jgi:hypothetical protein